MAGAEINEMFEQASQECENLTKECQNATEETEEMTEQCEDLGERAVKEYQDAKKSIDELMDRIDEAKEGVKGKTEDTRQKLSALQTAMAEALEAMQRINGLVRKLVDAGRLARTPGASDRAQLLQVARQAVDEARLRTGERVAFSIEIPPAAQVAVRTEVLHQILSSLLLNAGDAIPPGRTGRVEVGAGPAEGGQLRITVRDDGQGMAEEVRRRAFEPFFTTKGEGRGSGLGLPVARALVESHGGDLALESVPGRGTTAVLSLPEAKPLGR